MTFSKNLFIVLFAVTVTAYQLNAMEQKALTAMFEKPVASDFQIYQLLSAATKDNPELYLPAEVTHIIATNAYEISAECYEKYGTCLDDLDTVLDFIRNSIKKFISHMAIVNILKTCLNYCGKSLSEIKDPSGYTVFHYMSFLNVYDEFCSDYIKIISLVAGDQTWDLITERDNWSRTALHIVLALSLESSIKVPYINELLKTAPSPEQAWSLINTRNCGGSSVLDLALSEEIREILESYRPSEPVKH